MISDEDFLRLFNACAVVAKTEANPPVPAISLEDRFADLNIDSLDGLILGMYICDAFKVPEEVGKTMKPASVKEMMVFLAANATVDSIDVDDFIESLK